MPPELPHIWELTEAAITRVEKRLTEIAGEIRSEREKDRVEMKEDVRDLQQRMLVVEEKSTTNKAHVAILLAAMGFSSAAGSVGGYMVARSANPPAKVQPAQVMQERGP